MKTASLAAVGLVTAVLWRVELHLRWGWASLDWIDHFHWAVPLGAALCLYWMWAATRSTQRINQISFLTLAAGLGLTGYVIGGRLMYLSYGRWLLPPPAWMIIPILVSPWILYVMLGAIYFIALWRLGMAQARLTILGAALYLLACPLALLLLWLTHHPGGADMVHVVKSGFAFPWIVFGLGLPLVPISRNG